MLERASEPGGTWRDNTYPGCACDVPTRALLLLVRAETGLEPGLRAAGGDPPLPARRRRRARRRRPDPLRRRRARRRLGRGPQRWLVPTSAGDYAARGADLGDRARGASRSSPSCRDWTASRARSSTPRAGTTSTRSTAPAWRSIGTGASAVQFVPEIQPRGRAADRLPAHRPLGPAQGGPSAWPPRSRALPPLPGHPARAARGALRHQRDDRRRDAQSAAAGAAAGGRPASPAPLRPATPSCAASSPPTTRSAASGCSSRTTGTRR